MWVRVMRYSYTNPYMHTETHTKQMHAHTYTHVHIRFVWSYTHPHFYARVRVMSGQHHNCKRTAKRNARARFTSFDIFSIFTSLFCEIDIRIEHGNAFVFAGCCSSLHDEKQTIPRSLLYELFPKIFFFCVRE